MAVDKTRQGRRERKFYRNRARRRETARQQAPRWRLLIMTVYGVTDRQVSGGPNWVNSEYYDIEAKAQHPAGREQILQMLQALLSDRFRLKLRKETREIPIYALAGDGKGYGLRESKSWDRPRVSYFPAQNSILRARMLRYRRASECNLVLLNNGYRATRVVKWPCGRIWHFCAGKVVSIGDNGQYVFRSFSMVSTRLVCFPVRLHRDVVDKTGLKRKLRLRTGFYTRHAVV